MVDNLAINKDYDGLKASIRESISTRKKNDGKKKPYKGTGHSVLIVK